MVVEAWLKAWKAEGKNPKYCEAALKAAKNHPQRLWLSQQDT